MSFQPQVDPEHYQSLHYEDQERFLSYWKQIDLVRQTGHKSVLEVGIGNGFVHRYLRRHAIQVHTVDADPRLSPDTVADITALPFADRRFEVSCCFETLEHIPFTLFYRSLRELARVSSNTVLISVPDVTPYFNFQVEFGFVRKLFRRFSSLSFRDLPNPHPNSHRFNGEHYWEIGYAGYPLERICRTIESAGLSIEKHDRMSNNAYHRFFLCRING